jgi:hypothetical protein
MRNQITFGGLTGPEIRHPRPRTYKATQERLHNHTNNKYENVKLHYPDCSIGDYSQ